MLPELCYLPCLQQARKKPKALVWAWARVKLCFLYHPACKQQAGGKPEALKRVNLGTGKVVLLPTFCEAGNRGTSGTGVGPRHGQGCAVLPTLFAAGNREASGTGAVIGMGCMVTAGAPPAAAAMGVAATPCRESKHVAAAEYKRVVLIQSFSEVPMQHLSIKGVVCAGLWSCVEKSV